MTNLHYYSFGPGDAFDLHVEPHAATENVPAFVALRLDDVTLTMTRERLNELAHVLCDYLALDEEVAPTGELGALVGQR